MEEAKPEMGGMAQAERAMDRAIETNAESGGGSSAAVVVGL